VKERRSSALVPIAVVLVIAVATVGLIAVATSDAAHPSGERVPGMGPQGGAPQFKVECAWSHAATDDPIVHPGRPGRSHRHDFFGNTATDASSTPGDLVDGETTCQNKLDTAAYWAPAVYRDGTPVVPAGSVAYYRPGPGVDPATVRAHPAGLVMISGDAATSKPQPLEVAAWRCGASPLLHTEPPICPRTAPLGVRIAFPDCWDGKGLDSTDHRSHVAHSEGGRCPDDHPVALAQLIFEVHYPVSGDSGGLELASGGTWGVHADFVNAWDQETLEREVRVCLNRSKVCGVVSNRATG
jgi:hypothetical protein